MSTLTIASGVAFTTVALSPRRWLAEKTPLSATARESTGMRATGPSGFELDWFRGSSSASTGYRLR